jgi:MFS family permease
MSKLIYIYEVGVGLTMCTNAAPLLLVELSYPTQRGKISSIYNSSWYIGSIISAWVSCIEIRTKCESAETLPEVCFGAYISARASVWSWRAPSLVQGFVPLLQVLLIWFIPESPRFLVSKGMVKLFVDSEIETLIFNDICRKDKHPLF